MILVEKVYSADTDGWFIQKSEVWPNVYRIWMAKSLKLLRKIEGFDEEMLFAPTPAHSKVGPGTNILKLLDPNDKQFKQAGTGKSISSVNPAAGEAATAARGVTLATRANGQ